MGELRGFRFWYCPATHTIRKVIVQQLDYDLAPVACSVLVGRYLKELGPILGRLDAALPVKRGAANCDIVRR